MTSLPARKILKRWIDFFCIYWHLLNKDQRESYLAMVEAGKSPPEMIEPGDLPKWDQSQTMRHMGKTIRHYRESKGMDQKFLASALGKTSSHLSLIESGQKTFTVVDLLRVAQLLSIPASELFITPTTHVHAVQS